MKHLLKIFALSLTLLAPQIASADIIAERQANFSASGKALRLMGRAIEGGDYAFIGNEADKLAKWADMIPDAFPEGSENKKASPDIWTNFALFTQMAEDFGTAARALSDASATGDASLMKAGLTEVGATCQSCHRRFRNR